MTQRALRTATLNGFGLPLLLLSLLAFASSTTFAQAGATFQVTTTADNGDDTAPVPGSLREAILKANQNPGKDRIVFSIRAALPLTFAPVAPLPEIADPVEIDGRTAPGFASTPVVELSGAKIPGAADGLFITAGDTTVRSMIVRDFKGNGIHIRDRGGNTLDSNFIGTDSTGTVDAGNGLNGVLVVDSPENKIADNVIAGNEEIGVVVNGLRSTRNEIRKNRLGTDSSGAAPLPNGAGVLIVDGEENTLQGNVISANKSFGVEISRSSNNDVVGNMIGTDATGTRSDLDGNLANGNELGNKTDGVRLTLGASANEIGKSGVGNVISGNGENGVVISGSADNFVEANKIGTDANGARSVGNGRNGVALEDGSSGNTVGGTATSAPNTISGNKENGVLIQKSNDNKVQGNKIGTDATGTRRLGNGREGVRIEDDSRNNRIEKNVISANSDGMSVVGAGATGNTIAGNFIGTDATGTIPLGNAGAGVGFAGGSSLNTVGGLGIDTANVIFDNSFGVIVFRDSRRNAILGNSISRNRQLGIDLNLDRVSGNDSGDADTGGNDLTNFPVLTRAFPENGTTKITGILDARPNTSYRCEFFANAQVSPSRHGEGQILLGAAVVTTDGDGRVDFAVPLPLTLPGGYFVAATATDPARNTSEFSPVVTMEGSGRAALELSMSGPRTVTECGAPLRYTIAVRSTGTASAPDVTIVNTLPPCMRGLGDTTRRSFFMVGVNKVVSRLGTLNPGETATFAIDAVSDGTCSGNVTSSAAAIDPATLETFAGGASVETLVGCAPRVESAVVKDNLKKGTRNLVVTGTGFDSGAVVLIDGTAQVTKNQKKNPTTRLVAVGAGATVQDGSRIRVRNPNGTESDEFGFKGR